MTELKPCPFCGGEVRILHDVDGTPSGVHCKCGALVRFLFMLKVVGESFGVTQERIVERWNRRAEVLNELSAADAVPVIRCKDCKYNRNPPSAGNALCDNFYGMTDQNGFCHFGERRTDGTAD